MQWPHEVKFSAQLLCIVDVINVCVCLCVIFFALVNFFRFLCEEVNECDLFWFYFCSHADKWLKLGDDWTMWNLRIPIKIASMSKFLGNFYTSFS